MKRLFIIVSLLWTLPVLCLSMGKSVANENDAVKTAEEILDKTGVKGGIIVHLGCGDGEAANQQGELCTRGFLMKEYYKMPAATAAAVDKEGWFHTGDLGEMDEKGYVKITGRLKDVIVRDGVDIYPVEVEEIIYQLPEISEAQVFGFPHPQKGQEVAAWVKLKAGTQLSLDRLAQHVRKHLSEEGWPKHYKIVSEFPMTGSGKIQKFKLAEMGQREYV